MLPIVGFFLLVLAALMFFLPTALHSNTADVVVADAVDNAKQLKRLRTYYSTNILQSVVSDSDISASTQHKQQAGVIPVPATFLHDVSQEMSDENTQFAFYSPYPFANRSGRQLDEFGRNAWAYLNENPDAAYAEMIERDGQQFMRVGVADRLSAASCVACHNSHPDSPKRDWQLGQVRGVLEMTVNIDNKYNKDNSLVGIIAAILCLLLVAVLAVVGFSFSRFIKSKVCQITKAVDRVVDGDLTVELKQGNSKDELSVIMTSFNRLTQQYHQTVELISASSLILQEKANALHDITLRTRDGSQQQFQLTADTEASMAQMLDTVQQVVDSSSHATDIAVTTESVSAQGKQVVDDSVVVIKGMSEQAEQSTQIIHQLQENVEQIGDMSSVIGSIAEQTNLLALNAAIEAARAGEQGRGFAVVADEVRSLASKTKDSTDKIDQILTDLKGTTGVMVESMELTNDKAANAVTQIQSTEESLSSISQQVAEITQANQQIKQSTDAQVAVSDTVNSNISRIADISREVSGGAEDIAQSTEALNEISRQMSEQCRHFTLK